jgi:hypothetical protein
VPVFFRWQREVIGSFGSQPVVALLELVEGFVEAAAEFGHDGLERRDDPLGEDEFVDRGLFFHVDRVPGTAWRGKRVSAGARYPGSRGRPSASMTRVSKKWRPCLAAVDR